MCARLATNDWLQTAFVVVCVLMTNAKVRFFVNMGDGHFNIEGYSHRKLCVSLSKAMNVFLQRETCVCARIYMCVCVGAGAILQGDVLKDNSPWS